MALWSFTSQGFTPVAVLDGAAYTDNGYMGLMGGSTTQRVAVQQITMGGLAASSAPMPMVLSRDSTLQVTPTALGTAQSNGPLDAVVSAASSTVIAFTASTTKPQRGGATVPKVALAFNGFGGLVRWDMPAAAPFTIVGNATVSISELSLSCYTGGTPGLISASILYEPT